MDTPYRVEPAERSARPPLSYNIVTSNDGVLCRVTDMVFAHKLVDLLNADASSPSDRPRRPS